MKQNNIINISIGIMLIILISCLLILNTAVVNDDNNETIFNTITNIIYSKTSISTLMHNTIDPLLPNYLITANTSCNLNGGIWIDSNIKMGCEDMIIGTFDARNCITSPDYVLIGNSCNGLGATWICTSTDVICIY